MPRITRPYHRALIALLGLLLAGAWTAALISRPTAAHAASADQLQQKINQSRNTVSNLAGTVSRETGQINHLGNSISALENRISTIQADLDAKRAQLVATQQQLAAARKRLTQLQAYLMRANALLTDQLVSSYEGDTPDIVSVVLDSTGFTDLLEKLSFQQRIHKQNALVISTVRAARRAVATEATKLGHLEVRQQALTQQVLSRRNQLYSAKVALVRQQIVIERSRGRHAGKLSRARGRLSTLEGQLAALRRKQAEEAAAAARRAALQRAAQQAATASDTGSGPVPTPGPAPGGSGGFVFPLPRGSVVGPGSWTLDDGVDMAAPGDTPEYAVCSGTIVLHGIGGFGPWAPVLHCDGSVGGYSYVYYGHAGPLYQLPVGTHVSAGQVISSIGPGIVGMSTGPHIEIGFCDGSGTPIGPSSAGTMMGLLHASY